MTPSPTEPTLRVGGEVLWRGGFGHDAPRRATVEALEVTVGPRQKYGEEADEAPWALVRANRVVVSLTNGHWAYGEQIAPVPPQPSPFGQDVAGVEDGVGGTFSDADPGL